MAYAALANDTREPLILTIPGLGNSGPGHWQSLWECQRDNCRRVDLGMWDRPHRNTWVNKLNHAIEAADGTVILAAHSLGCLAVAWWAQLEQPGPDGKVRGALLVAPPDVDHRPLDARLTTFAPMPQRRLPFPSILVGSHNDEYMRLRDLRHLAKAWGSSFADAGRIGHINADSGIGEWQFGQFLVGQLIQRAAHTKRAAAVAGNSHGPDAASAGPAMAA